MDARWKPIGRDSQREVRVILHPTASLWDVRRGLEPGSNDAIELSDFVTTATQSAFEVSVTLKFNREMFGENQPKPNQVLEIQLKQRNEWKPLWLGIVDAINSFTLQRGERSMQLIAKTRDQQDIWRKAKRITPLFPVLTNMAYIANRVARSAGMQGDEILLPPTAMTTAHGNTQMADMNAWDMISAVFTPLGWTPFIDNLGCLRAADRGLQGRTPDAWLTDDRMVKVGGQRQRPPVSRVRVSWLNPTLKKYHKQGQILTNFTVTLGWWTPYWKKKVWFSDDHTLRADNTYPKVAEGGHGVNTFAWSPFVKEIWQQQGENVGKMSFINFNFAGMVPILIKWMLAHNAPDTVPHEHTVAGVGGGTTIPPSIPTPIVTVPVGRRSEAVWLGIFMYLMMNVGTGNYDIWGYPFDYVHARNVSEAFDSSVPQWIDNVEEIESDFIVNEEHAKAVSVRELIYRARANNKWSVTIVDDPRVEYGDILQFPDGSQLYVEDFSRQLERGSEATLNITGFLVNPWTGSGRGSIVGGLPGEGGGVDGGPVVPPGIPPGGGEGGEPTIPNYSGIAHDVENSFNTTVPMDQAEQGKAQMTRAIAWAIYQQDPNVGLLEKTYGNQVMNLSTDVIVQQSDGSWADVATTSDNPDGTVTIHASWQPHAPGDLKDRWVQPTSALATASGPMTPK